jgi:hypothetical protein
LLALDVRKPSYATDSFLRQLTFVVVVLTSVKIALMKVFVLVFWAFRPLTHRQILEKLYLHKF